MIARCKEEWGRRYKINEEDLLLVSLKGSMDPFLHYFESKSVSNIRRNRQFLLFDKSNMVKIDQNNKISVMKPDDQLDKNSNLIMLLHHNDSSNDITPIQYVMTSNNIKYKQIGSYIKNGFIARNEKQKEFSSEFEENAQKNGSNSLNFFHHRRKSKWIQVHRKTPVQTNQDSLFMLKVIVFSLEDIEIRNYPKMGQLYAYAKSPSPPPRKLILRSKKMRSASSSSRNMHTIDLTNDDDDEDNSDDSFNFDDFMPVPVLRFGREISDHYSNISEFD